MNDKEERVEIMLSGNKTRVWGKWEKKKKNIELEHLEVRSINKI